MKKFRTFFHILILIFSIMFVGCGDEGINQALNPLTPAAPSNAEVTTVPPEIQGYLFDKPFTREELVERLIDFVRTNEGESVRTFVDHQVRFIALADHQRAYYQKYIDAGGIAL